MSLVEARRQLGEVELARIALDRAEQDQLFAAGCFQRHGDGEFKQVTQAVLVFHNERVRLARLAWLAAMREEARP